MANSNDGWQWSDAHRRYYRQVYTNGKWDTIYAPSGHIRSDSAVGGQSGYALAVQQNQAQYSTSTLPAHRSIAPVAEVPAAEVPVAKLPAAQPPASQPQAPQPVEAQPIGAHSLASQPPIAEHSGYYRSTSQSQTSAAAAPPLQSSYSFPSSTAHHSHLQKQPGQAYPTPYSHSPWGTQPPQPGAPPPQLRVTSSRPQIQPSYSYTQHSQSHAQEPNARPPFEYPQTWNSHPHNQTLHPHAQSSLQPQRQVPSTLPRGEGLTVKGSYVQGQQYWETLDPLFYVRGRDFFKEGKVFAILFTENCGSTTVTGYNTSISISTVRFGESVYTQIRRFIVVSAMREFCYACPIFTYSGRATLKPGVRPDEHAIAYSYGKQPELLEGEGPLRLNPFCIIGADGTPPLNKASRIYFGIHHPIQYNVKVKDLGEVSDSQIHTLRGYWTMLSFGQTNQAPEDTAAGGEDVDEEEEEEEEEEDEEYVIQ